MNSKKVRTIVIITVVVIALTLIKIYSGKSTTQAPQNKPAKSMAVPVTVYVAKSQAISQVIQTSGNLIANEEVEIKSEISGKITKIYFLEGTHVNRGEVLVKIYDSDLQAQLKKFESQKALFEKKETRQKQLLAINGISQQEYDNTVNQINGVKADMEVVRVQIQKTEIIAPFSGVIGLKSVSVGAYITPTVKIAFLQQTDSLKLDFSIPEKYMSMVAKNDWVTFSVHGYNQQFTARVYAMEPRVNAETRTLQLRAYFSNREAKLLPCTFAQIKLSLKQYENSVLIPTQAVIPDAKGQKVLVVKDGKSIPRKVETGIRTDSIIQIIKGIETGDSVVITGIMQLKPEMNVKVLKSK